MRTTIVTGALVIACAALIAFSAKPANAQQQIVFGEGATRIELMKDQRGWGQELRFRTPSFSGVIQPVPTLRLMNVRIDVGDGEYFELRVPADGMQDRASTRQWDQSVRERWSQVQQELDPLVQHLRESRDFAPYAGLFRAMSEGRGVLSYVRETDVFLVNRYRVEQAAGAAEVIEVTLGGRLLHFALPPNTDSFSVQFAVLPRNDARIEFVPKPMGVYAYVTTQGLPEGMNDADVLASLRRLMEDTLPALLVAASGNVKLLSVHNILAEKLSVIRNVKYTRKGGAFAPPALAGTGSVLASAQPLPGYALSLERHRAERSIYYYRTPVVNGFILLNRYPDKSHLLITANRSYFNPDPMDAETLPVPDFTWELDYPRGVNEPGANVAMDSEMACCSEMSAGAGGASEGIDYQALPEGDLWLYYQAAGLFEEALGDDAFRERVPGELVLALNRFREGYGTFRPDEAFKPLYALSFREVQGTNALTRVDYQDPEYYFRLNLPPQRDYLSFSFSYGEDLSPLLYRFFLAPSGERTQLVVTYPVTIPLGRAALRFKRASAHLNRVERAAIYFAKQEPGLSELRALIADIMRRRELVGPKVFMRPLPGPPYTDWLDAESLRQ